MTVQYGLIVVPAKVSKKTTLVLSPKAEAGQLEATVPVVQVEGSEVSELWASTSLAQLPPVASRKARFPLVVPRIAIQYRVPAARLAAGTRMGFQAPATGVVLLPWLSKAPGCPPASAYNPTANLDAVEVESR